MRHKSSQITALILAVSLAAAGAFAAELTGSRDLSDTGRWMETAMTHPATDTKVGWMEGGKSNLRKARNG